MYIQSPQSTTDRWKSCQEQGPESSSGSLAPQCVSVTGPTARYPWSRAHTPVLVHSMALRDSLTKGMNM